MRRLAILILALLGLALTGPLGAQQRTSPYADDGDVLDWNHYYINLKGRALKQFAGLDWQGKLPTSADIAAAADERLAALRKPYQYHIGVPLPGGGMSQPDANTPFSHEEIGWSAIYSMHKPGVEGSNVVLLLVSSKQVIQGPVTEPWVNRAEDLRFYALDRDASGAWVFPDDRDHSTPIGAIEAASREELVRQFTATMGEEGYVPGLSDGSGTAAVPGAVAGGAAVGAAGGAAGSGILSAPPPPGFAGIGPVPGPQTVGQAIAGAALPGLVIILVNTLAGLPGAASGAIPVGGGTPVPDPSQIEEIERRSRWLKDREEDLRQVREQKSFVAATAAGAGQAGFNTAAHEQQIADLTRREKELTEAISKGGGDTSYVATVRDTVQVGAGFVEANRIAKDYDKAQAIAAARVRMEQLERDRAQVQADYWKDVRDGFWGNMVKDVDAIPGQLHDAAKAGMDTVRDTVRAAGQALADPQNWHDAVKATMDTVGDLVAHPIDSAAKVGEFYGDVAKTAGKAAHHVVTHPVETIKSVLGVDNWEKAFDPNVPVTERVARALVGVFDTAATLAGVKQAVTAGKAAAEGLVRQLGKIEAAPRTPPMWIRKGYSSQTLKEARDFARQEQMGGVALDPRYKIVEDPSIKVEGIGGKLAGSKEGLMSGMTEEARRHAQLVTDRYGVRLDIRPTNQAAHDLIRSGEAVPKAPHCKSKTINEYDLHLGADPADAGKAGYFKPKEPSAADLERLSAEDQTKVIKRYKERMEEYKDQAEHIEELTRQGKVTVKHGVVYDGPTGKPYTGDHDLFDIRDATTGRPLPRYQIGPDGQVLLNADGTPKLNPVREQIVKELQQPPMSVQHGAHMDWKYDHLNDKVAAGSPKGTKSEFEVAQGIDRGVTGKHQQGSEPLITFVSGADKPVGSWFSGER